MLLCTSPSEPSSKALGDSFELEVCSHYEALGFKVQHDVDINGQQVDLLIQRDVPGLGSLRHIVECRFKMAGAVSNQEVADFANVLSELQRQNQVNGGIIVCNRGFSRNAKRLAQQNRSISLLSSRELTDERILRSEPARLRAEYEGSPIFQLYVRQEGFGRLPGLASDSTYRDLCPSLLRWSLTKSQRGACFVLGDYGTGKTTLLERLRYVLLVERLKGIGSPLPILFYLKNFYKFDNINNYIVHSFNDNYASAIKADWFWQECEMGRFVLLLDGFDEISIESNEQLRSIWITRLSPLLRTSSKAIISCRPSYFISAEELDEILQRHRKALLEPCDKLARSASVAVSFAEQTARLLRSKITQRFIELGNDQRIAANRYVSIELLDFSEHQIMTYLSQFRSEFRTKVGAEPRAVLDFLKSVYDLSDLMKRPILLQMIVDTILTGALDVHSRKLRVGPSHIYDIYVDGKLAMESGKGVTRHLLSKDERKEFSQLVAYLMYRASKLDVTFRELRDVVAEHGNISAHLRESLNSYEQIEKVASDVALCGFLNREGDLFRFSHRSFMEFFVARRIFLELRKEGASSLFGEGLLRKEIMYFLGSLIMYDDRVFESLALHLRTLMACGSGQEQELDGVVRALLYSERAVGRLEGESLPVRDVRVKALELYEVGVERLEMVGVEAATVELARSSVRELTITECEFGALEMRDCTLGLQRVERTLQRVTLKNGQIRFEGAVQLSDIQWDDASVEIFDEVSIHTGKLHRCVLGLAAGDRLVGQNVLRSRGVEFLGCRFYQTSLRHGELRIEQRNIFRDCFFDWIYVRGGDLSLAMGAKRTGGAIIEDCEGVILTRNQGKMLDPDNNTAKLLEEFDEGKAMKPDSRRAARSMLQANIVRLANCGVFVINVTYLRNYKEFREVVQKECRIPNLSEILGRM